MIVYNFNLLIVELLFDVICSVKIGNISVSSLSKLKLNLHSSYDLHLKIIAQVWTDPLLSSKS